MLSMAVKRKQCLLDCKQAGMVSCLAVQGLGFKVVSSVWVAENDSVYRFINFQMSVVLVLGSGGREHALAVALAASSAVSSVLVAPGNAGTQTTSGVSNISIDIKDHKVLKFFFFFYQC